MTSLDALAMGLGSEGELVVSVVDAGKGEVFVQATRARETVLAAAHVRVADVATRIAGAGAGAGASRILVVGEAASGIDWSALGAVTLVAAPPHDLPRASSVGLLAMNLSPADADTLEPLYVRPPEITMPRPRPVAPGGAA